MLAVNLVRVLFLLQAVPVIAKDFVIDCVCLSFLAFFYA